jgi:hypothetical protein
MKCAELKERNYQFKTNINMKTKTSILAPIKAFFILLVSCCLFSCTENGSGNAVTGQTNYSIEIIDGCEYLKRYEGYNSGYSFSHKGDCKNPIHYKVIHDTVYVVRSK